MRRKEMLVQLITGQPKKTVMTVLARKHGVQPNTLYQDWSRRQKWAPKTLSIDRRRLLGTYIVLQHRQINVAAWRAYRQAMEHRNFWWALGALGLIMRSTVQEVKQLQTLGFLPCVHKLR